MILTIPTTADAFQRMTVRLDGRDYVIELRYNQREECWYLSIADDESTPILSGLKLQANWPLLWRHRYDTRVPPGEILVATTSTDRSPPTLNDFGEGKRCELTYYDAAWLKENGPPAKAVSVTIYIAVRVTALGGYPGDAAFAAALTAACAGLVGPGTTVSTSDVLAVASGIAGATVTGLAIGKSPPSPPVTIVASTISIGANQLARISVSSVVSA